MWVKTRFSERQIFSRQAAKIAKEAKEIKDSVSILGFEKR
jgi:hypothetical protein